MKFSELNVISIDPSLKSTGIFLTRTGSCEFLEVIQPKKNHHDTVYNYLCSTGSIEICLIEKPLMNKTQSEIVGVIKAAMQAAIIPYVEIHPDIWRHIMGVKQLLKGINKKTAAGIRLYLDRVKSITCKSFDTTDEADAYMMYSAVCDIMDKPGRLTQAAERIRLEIRELLK